MTLLKTERLCKRFDGLTAVDQVSLELEAGEIRALIGPNGAGKTTLVSLLSGRLPPSQGQIWFDGREVTTLPAEARVRLGLAYTFQITSVFASLTVAENVALAAQRRLKDEAGRWSVRASALSEAIDDALSRVGLVDRREDVAAELSYGHQRLLEVAMGIALKPRLLMLDEPTQGLSDAEIDGFKALVRDLAATTTILLIEHNMSVVMDLADRITVLTLGKVLASGAPADIRADSEVQAAYLGAPAC